MKNDCSCTDTSVQFRTEAQTYQWRVLFKAKKGTGKTTSKKEYVCSRIKEWDCISENGDVLRRFFRGLGIQIKSTNFF